ncbi:MAG: DNA ligase, partial [bacterium]|nr:DNA ligase [Candidatus Kapabacteria bacterium]
EMSRPSFSLLQGRMHLSDRAAIAHAVNAIPIAFLVFDVLAIDGEPVMNRPYTERRTILEGLKFKDAAWQTPGWIAGAGQRMLVNAREAGYEGIVAKRLDSAYQQGERSGAWLKIKVRQRQEFVVAGYVPGNGRNADRVGSLMLGYFTKPKHAREQSVLRYAGNVGTGMSEIERSVLKRELDAIKRSSSPFAGAVPTRGPGGPVVFAEPELVAEVSHAELTPGGLLRHPVYHGLRLDKEAEDVVLEN